MITTSERFRQQETDALPGLMVQKRDHWEVVGEESRMEFINMLDYAQR